MCARNTQEAARLSYSLLSCALFTRLSATLFRDSISVVALHWETSLNILADTFQTLDRCLPPALTPNYYKSLSPRGT